jgi:hypothetical protein
VSFPKSLEFVIPQPFSNLQGCFFLANYFFLVIIFNKEKIFQEGEIYAFIFERSVFFQVNTSPQVLCNSAGRHDLYDPEGVGNLFSANFYTDFFSSVTDEGTGMILDFLWKAYLAHSSLFDNIALIIIGIALFFGTFSMARALDRDLEDLG